jgi:hypothetical protein
MTWFKVDDGLHAHRKVVRAGVAAMGLWVLAGSWSSDQLTDGWVPDYIATRLDPGQAEKHAAALVRAGLWFPDEHDGERGWWFHQWSDHQPTSKSVHDQRAAARDRMTRLREARRLARSDDRKAKSQDEPDVFDECSHEQLANVPANFERSSLTPTRPDPTRSSYGTRTTFSAASAATPKRGTRIPADFVPTAEMVAWARKHAPDVDGRYETAQFADYWAAKSGRDATKVDWVRTWQTWMRRAQKDAGRSRSGARSNFQPYLNPTDPDAYSGYHNEPEEPSDAA